MTSDRAGRAVVLAVDDNEQDLATLERELRSRYGTDYDVRTAPSAFAALEQLEQLKAEGRAVALVLASQWMTDMVGTDLLGRVGALHPMAKRGLLISWGDRLVAGPMLEAMARGRFDGYLTRPSTPPDEGFHTIVEGFLANWARVEGHGFTAVVAVGDPATARMHELRDVLTRNGLSYRVHDPGSPEGTSLLDRAGLGGEDRPVLFVLDHPPLVDPSNLELADAFGVNAAPLGGEFDVVVVGAGPAGLGAAVYGASEGLRTMVLEREALGGQAGTSSLIRNFLGFPTGVSGSELAVRAYEQAWMFGAGFHFMRAAAELRPGIDGHEITLAGGSCVTARSVVLAMGAAYRRLDVPGADALAGAGVFYGAAVSEAPAVRGERVVVVGGGNSAGQAALHLAKYAATVTILVRGAGLADTMSSYLITHLAGTANVEVRTHREVVAVEGAGRLERLTLRDTATGATTTEAADALFVLIGALPRTDWLPAAVTRDPWGYVVTGADLVVDGRLPAGWWPDRAPMLLETSVPGIFAAGDVRHRSVKRVASAVGEGSIAITLVHEHLRTS